MENFDVQPELMGANLSPQEGSANIDKANIAGLEPDAFIDNKDLNQNVENIRTQIKTTAPIARKLSESRSVASVMKEEVPAWNNINKIVSDIGNSISNSVPDFISIHNDQRRASQLRSDKLDRPLTAQEQYELRRLEGKVQRYNKSNPGLSEGGSTLDFAQGLGETISGALLDIPLSIKDNPTLASTTIGLPTAVGATRGAITGGAPGALIGGTAAGIAAAAAPTGLPLIQAVDQFRIIRGDVQRDLEQAGVPVNVQRQYANGAAVVGSLFEIVGFGKLLGNVPVVKRMGKKVFGKIAVNAAAEAAGKSVAATATERTIGNVIKSIGAASLIEGGQEGFQELTQQVFTAGGLKFNPITKDGDMAAGISSLWDQYKASANTLLKEGKLTGKARDLAVNILGGAVAGPAIAGGLTVATEVPVKVAKTVGEKRRVRAEQIRSQMSEAVNNRIINRLAGMQLPMEGMPRIYRGAEGQQAQVVLEEMVKLTNETQLKQLQPAQADQLIADIAHDAGVPFVWLDPDDVRQFSDDPTKAADVTKMLSNDQKRAATKDTQVRVRFSDALNFVKKYPETSGMFAFSPGALSANEAIKRTEEMKAKQQEILNKVAPTPTVARPEVEGLVNAEQANARLTQEQAKLEDMRAHNAPLNEIQQQEQIIRNIEARKDVLPSEEPSQTEMDFAEQFAMKKAREAQDIELPMGATQEQVDAAFTSREQAEAYWDRLDREEQRLIDQTNKSVDQLKNKKIQKRADILNKNAKNLRDILTNATIDQKLEVIDAIKPYINSAQFQYIQDAKSDLEILRDKNNKYPFGDLKTVNIDKSISVDEISGERTRKDLIDKLEKLIEIDIDSLVKASPKVLERLEMKATLANILPTLQDNNKIRNTDRIQEIQDLKAKVEYTIASTPSEIDQITQLQGDIATNEDTFGVQRYNEQTVIPPELTSVIPQAKAIETMSQEANKQYHDAVMDAAEREWTGVVNEQERIALTVQREIEAENLQNDPDIGVVENFLNSKNLDPSARELLGGTKTKSRPAFAINPESLTPSEREAYLNNPKMVERGVFDKKGMNAADAAQMSGAKDVSELLRILSETPTRQEAIDAAVKRKSEQLVNQIASETDFNQTAIARSLNDKTNAAKNALEYFKNGDWSGFKKAIKAVVLPLPKVEDIRARAERDARQTRISDLGTAQFKKGELRSRRKAADAVLKGDLQTAFEHKTNEIENIEAARANHKIMGEVNKRTNKVAKFFTPEVKATLEAAGPKYVDAIEDIMSAFNLSPYAKGQQKQGAYEALAKEMANRGQGDIALPEHVVADFDPRMGWDSLTAEQYIEIVDLMDNVYSLARQKKRTVESYTGKMRDSMISVTESAAIGNLADHPDRDITRAEQETSNTIPQAISSALGEMEALISNTNFAVQHLDRGQTDGFWHKLIVERIKGIGAFTGVFGTEARNRLYTDVRNQFSSLVKTYGSLKFNNLGSERITVKQFEGIPGLYNGNMTKLDLLVMALNMGNQGNIDRVSNFGIGEEIVWEAMNEHLTTKEMDFAQGIWDIYRAMEDRVVALEKMDGENVELIQSKPFTFKGKEYRGGYAPIQFVTSNHEGLLGRIKNTISDMFGKTNDGYSANYAARGMTQRGYTEKRVGSDQRISLDVRTIALGLDEVITDLTMRVPVRDTYKLLTNKTISSEIMSVIGKARYKAMVDGIASLTTSEISRRLNGMIQGEATLDNFFSNLESAEAVTSLAFNIQSLLMQPVSVGTAIENMGGIRATKHIANVVAKLAVPWNWHRIGERFKLAKEINPSIENAKNNLESKNTAGITDLLPTRRVWGGKPVNMLALVRDHAVNTMMGLFAAADVSIKTPITLAAYEQYLKGEAPGQDGYALYHMSPEEKHRAAVSYAQKISESALTHTDEFNKANIQKTTLGKRFARYFNDLRNQLNTTIMSSRQLNWNFNQANKLAIEGDVEGSAKAYHSVADKALSMAIVSITMGLYEKAFKAYGSEDDDELSPAAVTWAAAKTRFIGSAPLVRELTFSLETGQAPGIPITRIAGNVSQGISSIGTILNNYTGLLNDTESDNELTDKQLKGLLSTVSYVFGGLPINGPWKIVNAATNPEAKNVGPEKLTLDAVGYFIDRAERFIEKYKDNPKMKPITDAVQKDLNAVKVVSGQPFEISDIDLAAFRQAENPKGEWDATNPNSTAFGNYQITEGTWLDIVRRAPKSLGLTDDGLYDKDGKQAEKGIKWLISDNARILQDNGVEPTLENIYGAHHFGAKGWVKVIESADSKSVESAFSSDAIAANPWLQRMQNVGEAKQFISDYITKAKYTALRESRKRNMANNP